MFFLSSFEVWKVCCMRVDRKIFGAGFCDGECVVIACISRNLSCQ